MAKIVVIKEPDGDRTPFLRGILVQSLVNAGLCFEDAYTLAQKMRDELRDTQEITSTELKERVAILLDRRFGASQRLAYEDEHKTVPDIIVHTSTRSAPFSAGILAHSLEACAIPAEMAMQGARKVYTSLRQTGHREIDHRSLRRIIYRCVLEHCSQLAADRYLSWRRFENSGEPLIILIGGTTGSGKSTVASEIAYHMDIARVQSTDMMREIIRAYLTPEAMPTLCYSSFEAWRGLPASPETQKNGEENRVTAGFLSQFATMKPALETTIARAVHERHHLIIEGVHALAPKLDLSEASSNAIIVPLMLATMKKALLGKQLKRRGHEKTERQASRYLEHLEDIWELQSYLLDEADQAGIPIITNLYIEQTVREILDLISARIMRRYPPQPQSLDSVK